MQTLPQMPDNPEDQLRGLKELHLNPFYLALLARLASEEITAAAEVFQGKHDSNEHFVNIGRALGLARVRDAHAGMIEDLETKLKETNATE